MSEAIAGIDGGYFWLLWLLAAAGSLGALYTAFRALAHARTIENTPTALLRSAAQGHVEFEGRSLPLEGPPIVAPLTRRECCWWCYKIEERKHNRRNAHWETIESGLSDGLFQLVDSTGQCVVDPHGASVEPGATDVWYGNRATPDVPPAVGSGWWRALLCEYRYTEHRLEVGAPLYAMGWFRTQAGADTQRHADAQEVKALLAEWKRDPKMRAVLDTNRDGRIDQKEWDAARRMAESRALRSALERPPAEDVDVLRKPSDGRPYLLAGLSQADLVQRYQRRFMGWLTGSMVLGGLCVHALEARHLL